MRSLRIISITLIYLLTSIMVYGQAKSAEVHQEVKVKAEVVNGVRTTTVQIKNSDGTEQNYNWEGKEIPSAIAEKLEELKIDLNLEEELEGLKNEERIIEKKEIIKGTRKEEKHVKVVIKDENGEKKVEWSGEGEIPEEIQKELEGMDALHPEGGKKSKIIIKSNGGEEQVYEWYGDEMPDEIKQSLQDEDIDPSLDMSILTRSDNRAFLGIAMAQSIEETVENDQSQTKRFLTIDEVIAGSGAEKAGLMIGDELLQLNGEDLETADQVVALLTPLQPGDEVHIKIGREGKKLDFNVNLTERLESASVEKRVVIDKKVVRDESVQENKIPQEPILELQDLNIHPNPSAGKLSISFKGDPLNTKILVTDMAGKTLYEETIPDFNGTYQQEIDLQNMPKGTLLIKIEQDGRLQTRKVVHQ